jgi:hypothetical protein
MKVAQFLALTFTALALVPSGAHLFAMPNKIGFAEVDYFIAQNVYRGWDLLGIVPLGAIFANLALTILLRGQKTPFLLALVSLIAQFAMLAIFFAFVFPTNVATRNWTVIPDNWEPLRWQWEMGHAVNAVIAFAGFCALTASVLTTRN